METFIRLLFINVLHAVAEKLYSIQFQTTQERHKRLIESNPDILLKAPPGHVAAIVYGEGISQIYTELKQMLASQAEYHATLIYFSTENNCIASSI